MPEYVFSWKIAPNKRLIHDGQRGAAVDLGATPQAPCRQRNIEDWKISWTYEIYSQVLLFSNVLSENFKRLVPAVSRRRGVRRDCGHLHPRHCGYALAQLREVSSALRPGVERVFVDGNANRNYVMWIVA